MGRVQGNTVCTSCTERFDGSLCRNVTAPVPFVIIVILNPVCRLEYSSWGQALSSSSSLDVMLVLGGVKLSMVCMHLVLYLAHSEFVNCIEFEIFSDWYKFTMSSVKGKLEYDHLLYLCSSHVH